MNDLGCSKINQTKNCEEALVHGIMLNTDILNEELIEDGIFHFGILSSKKLGKAWKVRNNSVNLCLDIINDVVSSTLIIKYEENN